MFASDWISDNYHHFTFGLLHHEGWLYGSLSTSIYFGNTIENENVKGAVVSMNGPNPPNRGTCFRVNLETRDIEYVCGGFRTPNGIGLGPDGAIFVCDNQGAWLPSSKLIHVQPERFFGHYNGTGEQTSDTYPNGGNPSLYDDQPESPPAIWMPQNEIANSPAESMLITDGPFAGQMYVAEITMGGLRRVSLEKVNGEYQGAIFRHSQGFESGLNRMVKGPDGCLYIGGIGAGGNWSWRGTQFGLQRLRPTGATAFEYHSITATADGFIVTFTEPVATAWLDDAANWSVSQWHYRPTAQYGGPKFGEQRLAVSRAFPSPDARSVRLVIPGLRADHVVYLHADAESADGEAIWSPEAWYTLNAIPAGRTNDREHAVKLVDRSDLLTFREPHGLWSMVGDVKEPTDAAGTLATTEGAGVLTNAAGRTSNIATALEHGDAMLALEFMVPKGSNSGIYLMGRYEIQILDSYGVAEPRHSDCGGVYQRWAPSRGRGNEGYDGVPPRENATFPPGEWQRMFIDFRAPRFDASGRKTENARFNEVVLNGVVIHENVEATGPTRAAMFNDERAYGPLMLQGDHGPVAYRNVRLFQPKPGEERAAATSRTSR
ncbi:MAG: family 16 glycoside hydrolase [Planctomycetota bacterium]